MGALLLGTPILVRLCIISFLWFYTINHEKHAKSIIKNSAG